MKSQQQEKTIQVVARGSSGAPGQVVAKARQQSREQESTKRQEKSTGKERIVFGQRMVKFCQTKIQKNFNGARGQAATKAKQ